MATKSRVICSQCEQPEERCECDKYCCLCQGHLDIRLWEDGLYYCGPCREVCGYKVAKTPE